MSRSTQRKSLEAEVLFIMNRLTPTNLKELATEMRKLNIETYEDLTELVKTFFDKVTMETKFVEAYAQLCKYMSGLKVTPPPNSGIKENQATFREVMLTKCQQEFQADKTTIFEDPEEKRKKIEAEMPDTPERATLIENTLYQMKLKRLKFYGNIRFIGELFKLGMLTEAIMHNCIHRLLKGRDDDSLLSLCNLITTVGQILDTEKAKARMDGYFVQMAKIAEERKSRIKFTLIDVIDLRNSNWVQHKKDTVLKKIEDSIHSVPDDEMKSLSLWSMRNSTGAQASQDNRTSPAANRRFFLKIKPSPEAEEMESKVKTIMEEYLIVKDFEKVKLSLMELARQGHSHILVAAIITEVQRNLNKEIDLFGSFFHEIIKQGLLPLDVFIKGIAEISQCAGDMDHDMWTDLAHFIVPSLLGGSVPLFTLFITFKYHFPGKYCATLITEILLTAKEKTSESEVAAMWQSSQLDWAVFLPCEEVPQFVRDNKLEFTVRPIMSSKTAG